MPLLPLQGAAAPTHHPSEDLLLDYATGGSSPAESLMLATHLACCKECRGRVGAAQNVGGALLDAIAPAPLPPDMLNRTLSAIDAGDRTPPRAEPPPLSLLLEDQFNRDDWRKLPGGFRMRRVAGDRSGRVWLFDAPPGMKVLPHRHAGDEWTVILTGLLVDNDRSYRPGDFACMADGDAHRPTIGEGERCVSLIMVRRSPLYTTLLGKLAAPFVKL